MKKLLLAAAIAAIGLTQAHADDTITYMCHDHHNHYPVTLDVGKTDDECKGDVTSCTITWRGKTWTNVQNMEDCKARYQGIDNKGVIIDLCAQTQGHAILTVDALTIDSKTYECQAPPRKR